MSLSTPVKVSPLIFVYTYTQFVTCDYLYNVILFSFLVGELHWNCVDSQSLVTYVLAVAIFFLPNCQATHVLVAAQT